MPDARVRHFWDGEYIAGRWFAKEVDGYEGTSWDTYYLYGPDATWESIPSPLNGSGSTIYGERETLKMQLENSLNGTREFGIVDNHGVHITFFQRMQQMSY